MVITRNDNTKGSLLLVSLALPHLTLPIFPPSLSTLPPAIESTLHRGPVAPVSTPSVLCTLWWGLARKDTSFVPGPLFGPGVLLLLNGCRFQGEQ
jgi:hypothetical protein